VENSAIETVGRRSISLNKFSGLAIASLIILAVYMVPAIPVWVVVIAAYPMLTSIIDIYLDVVTK